MAVRTFLVNLNGGDLVTSNNDLIFKIYGSADSYTTAIVTTGSHTTDANVTVSGSSVTIIKECGSETLFKISAQDEAGNESVLSNATGITDTTAPATPIIIGVVDLSTLKPKLLNFSVENATPTRVNFESTQSISGMTATGFTISGKTISSVTINGTSTSGHYFTVSSAFTFWDNNTIKLEGGDDTVYDFTLTHIENNISEPTASVDRFVEAGASGNGLLISTPASLTYAFANAVAGETWWIKAGDYGNVSMETTNSGTAGSPIKFIGYTSTTGDISSNMASDFDPTSTATANAIYDSATYPYWSGTNGAGTEGIFINGENYLVFKNIQIESHDSNILIYASASNILIENVTVGNANWGTGAGDGIRGGATLDQNNVRLKNCVALDNGILNFGVEGDYNLAIGCVAYSGLSTNQSTDYYFKIDNSNYSIIKNCKTYRLSTALHGGHAFGIKDSGANNLFYNNEAYGSNGETFWVGHQNVSDNVFKNNYAYRNPAWALDGALIQFRNGTYNNVFENIKGENFQYGINISNNAEDEPILSNIIANNNTVRNSILYNVRDAVRMSNDISVNYAVNNNKIYNNTFLVEDYSVNSLFNDQTDTATQVTYSGNEFKNNIVYGLGSPVVVYRSGATSTDFSQQYNVYYNCNSVPSGTGNISDNPNFTDFIDFVPQETALKAGTPLTGVEYDYDGTERDSTTPTIGAKEI